MHQHSRKEATANERAQGVSSRARKRPLPCAYCSAPLAAPGDDCCSDECAEALADIHLRATPTPERTAANRKKLFALCGELGISPESIGLHETREASTSIERYADPAGEVEPGSLGPAGRRPGAVREAPGGAVPVGTRGAQLPLVFRARTMRPVETESCAYCWKRAYVRVMTAGGPEPRCDRHMGGGESRLPEALVRAARGR